MELSSPAVHARCLARSSSTNVTSETSDAVTSVRQSLESIQSIPGLGTVLADSMEDIWAELADLRELVESRLNPPTDASPIRSRAMVSVGSRSRCVSAAGAELRAVLDKCRARAEGSSLPMARKPDSAAPFSFAGLDKGETMQPERVERFSIGDDDALETVRDSKSASPTSRVVGTKQSRVSMLPPCSEPREPPVPRRPPLPASEVAKSVNEALLATNGKIAGYQRDCNAQCSALAKNARELEEQIGEIGNDLAQLKSDVKMRLHAVARKCLDDQKRLGREMSEHIQATVATVESLDRTVTGLRASVDQSREQLVSTSTRLDDSDDGLTHCGRRLCELEDRFLSLEQTAGSPTFSNMEDVHAAIRDISAAAEQNARLNHSLNGAMQSLRTALGDVAAGSAPSTEVLHPTPEMLHPVDLTRHGVIREETCEPNAS